ncbi:F-box/WD repeat-containing protein pof11 [Golovinomyces cichoracearum]|uniref:F-box/WD repeat-containing protein pof11 n=1 Tax=Golovinomyces cichoracearum TaxID=62708 RepID=A0A420HN49_9PEZI|nr:F-box/WD repeat-containing protein pof11 [Golovinomyces cichoracearum]
MRKATLSSRSMSLPDDVNNDDPHSLKTPLSAPMPQWFLQMSVTERTGYVMNIISQLPTSQVAEIVSRLRPRLYINFFEHLPNEVLLHILSFLDPVSLLNTARASRQWMSLAMDSKLWEQLYIREGFRVNSSEVRKFEEEINRTSKRYSGLIDEIIKSNIRAQIQLDHSATAERDSKFIDENRIKPGKISAVDHCQQDKNTRLAAEFCNAIPDLLGFSVSSGSSDMATEEKSQGAHHKSSSSSDSDPKRNLSPLYVPDLCGTNVKYKLNWQNLYSQRRRLESNWEAEKYINFQLPDPGHPEEAHFECIYTIQHSGNYLVSGSRDRTIRIWNLETRRLVRPPLRAHSGSVLCVQFDADPKEDLIVSGSSDATVILWRFSTGKIIQRLRKAHKESVLNVQFDKRVLVTCSKDKTIKIFNRKPIHAGDLSYPLNKQAVDPVPTLLNNFGLDPAPTTELLIKPAYSLLAVLEGHGAAVNAVQIQGDEIVSASGDRLVKVWNWPEQTCVRTLIGHSKGIACVQYDGRRIVSGSSDNEVKVFDKETGLEVASLRAHTNLVRTVQAGFGDLPFSTEKDKADAREVDHEYFKALDSGVISGTTLSPRGRASNAGSRRPEHITAYGAKLPPGGGGGKFGRIVSGSYDETIIIWRRDKEGIWKAQHTLRQEEAAKAANRNTSLPSEESETLITELYFQNLIKDAVYEGPDALRSILAAHPQALKYQDYLQNQINSYPHDLRQAMESIVAAALSSNSIMMPSNPATYQYSRAQSPSSNEVQPSHQTVTNPAVALDFNLVAQESLQAFNHISTTNSTTNDPQTVQPLAQVPHNLPNQNTANSVARVFKLQFDARRIICCSQTNIIVGWDFANNDKRIKEVSRFFAPIE